MRYCLSFLLLIACAALAFGQKDRARLQSAGIQAQGFMDSITAELGKAGHDSTRLRLSYAIGIKVKRLGYWDSLLSLANRENPGIAEKIYNHRGLLLWNLQQMDKALECYQECLERSEQLNNKKDMILAQSNIGLCYYAMSDMKNALEHYFRALKIAESIKDRKWVAYIYTQLAACYVATNELSKALEFNFACLRVCEELKDGLGISMALNSIGTNYYAIGNYSLTAEYYLKTKKYLPLFGKNNEASQTCNAIGEAYKLQKQYDSAYKYTSRGYEIALYTNDKQAILSTKASLAGIYFERGNYAMAKKTALEAYELLKECNTIIQVPQLSKLLKIIYLKEGNYKKALEAYEMYVDAKDSLSNENLRKLALQKEFNYNLDKKESENKLLAQQNQIQGLQLQQNKYLMTGLGGLLVIVVLVGYLLVRQNRLRAAQQSMQLEQKLLRTQMNPHFIFNTLQAIQNYILKNNARDAIRYLGSFANVMRNVLENSRAESITLEQEITLLENYLQLQKLRFGSRFDYRINLDEAIDAGHTIIPPMLFQPFIENAIEHGMHDISTGGMIEVFYTIKDAYLLMEITDNGYGIRQTGAPGRQHQSLAIEITKERVVLMNRRAKHKTFFTIGEAFPLQDLKKGVKVSMHLPLA